MHSVYINPMQAMCKLIKKPCTLNEKKNWRVWNCLPPFCIRGACKSTLTKAYVLQWTHYACNLRVLFLLTDLMYATYFIPVGEHSQSTPSGINRHWEGSHGLHCQWQLFYKLTFFFFLYKYINEQKSKSS